MGALSDPTPGFKKGLHKPLFERGKSWLAGFKKAAEFEHPAVNAEQILIFSLSVQMYVHIASRPSDISMAVNYLGPKSMYKMTES